LKTRRHADCVEGKKRHGSTYGRGAGLGRRGEEHGKRR